MAKHPKSKTNGAQKASGEPYPKKARVEVTFEGAQPSSSKPSKTPKSTSSKTTPASSKAPAQTSKPIAKDKGKGKAVASVEPPARTDVPVTGTASGSSTTSGSFIITAGSYEKLLYGIEGTYTPGSDRPDLQPIFIFPAHLACVKAVAASAGGKWLATGSEDEFIKVWDLRRRKEVGSLSQHTGSITSLCFPTSSHLVTTSEDSTLSLFRTSDWALLKSLKGHSGRVNHVDVHPTGRVALSVGKDKTLKMWDLMRGRGAASLPLGTEAEMVKFSPLGTHFAVLYPKKIELYSLTLKLLHTLSVTGANRFNALTFSLIPAEDDEEEQEVLCVGTEKGLIEVYSVEIPEAMAEEDDEEDEQDEEEGGESSTKVGAGAEVDKIGVFTGHTNRVKAISTLTHTTPSSASHPAKRLVLLSSASSDGFIRLFDLTALVERSKVEPDNQMESVGEYDTKGSRLTVCCLADGKKVASNQKQATEGLIVGEEEESEEEGEDMYESGDDDEEEDDEEGMEVEIEDDDEDEDEEEEEGEEE